ncbi:MAG: glycosyltransferase family 2 protein [Steroidobacter sp.]
MKISIAMATYNGADYIREQLESFVAQDRKPDELIVSDDGSLDSTKEIVEEFSSVAPFPVFFSQNKERLGYAGNFSQALMSVTGDIVFLSDQDDVWFPNKLSMIEKIFEENSGLMLIMNDAELVDGKLVTSGLTKLGQIRAAGLSELSFVMGCCIAIRRELLRLLVPIPKDRRSHDEWLVQFAYGLEVSKIVPIVLQYYRRHGHNESKFFINNTKKISLIRAWYQRARAQVKSGISKTGVEEVLKEQLSCLNRIQKYREEFKKVAKPDRVLQLERDVIASAGILSRRHVIRENRNIMRRWLAAISLWYEGGYRGVGGFFQIVNDCMISILRR